MFNNQKVRQLERDILSIEKYRDYLESVVSRAVEVLNLNERGYKQPEKIGSFYVSNSDKLNRYLDDVEKSEAEYEQRNRIESIMRDLLKANVFKQV